MRNHQKVNLVRSWGLIACEGPRERKWGPGPPIFLYYVSGGLAGNLEEVIGLCWCLISSPLDILILVISKSRPWVRKDVDTF